MIKPILIINQKCECNNFELPDEIEHMPNCKVSGTQPLNIYALRDFEICKYCEDLLRIGEHNPPYPFVRRIICKNCNSTGYKIPFKDYEIKKVSEIKHLLVDKHLSDFGFNQVILKQFNLKEDDKVVITNSR